MTAFDDRPTRQTARPLHKNRQGEEGTIQEMGTNVGRTDGLDNEDAVPAVGATNPPDEDPKTDDPGQTPSRNKKIKLKKNARMRRERTRSRTRVAQPNREKIYKSSSTPRPLPSAVPPDGHNQNCHFKHKWHDISHKNSDARCITQAPRNIHPTST